LEVSLRLHELLIKLLVFFLRFYQTLSESGNISIFFLDDDVLSIDLVSN